MEVYCVPNALDGTVERAEHAAPDAKVTAQDGGAGLDGGQSTYPSLAVPVASSLSKCRPDELWVLGETYGLFLKPLIPCQSEPPIAPMQKAPPKSFRAL